jgi:GR25 family glycosyltransferase involved in LPS biosynthesis
VSAFCGLYINLDRSLDRREAMERQLKALAFENLYSRFPAVDGTTLDPGTSRLKSSEVAIFRSHHDALSQAKGTGLCVHLLEDDALLSEHVPFVIQDAIETKLFDRFDLLFTDMMVPCHVESLKALRTEFDKRVGSAKPLRLSQLTLLDLGKKFYGSFASYVVGANAVERVLSLYAAELERGPNVPVDIFIQQQVLGGALRAACVFPFVTSTRLDHMLASTRTAAKSDDEQASLFAMAVLQSLFFVDCDVDYTKNALEEALAGYPPDPRNAVMAQVMGFVLSKRFVGT